MMTLKFIRTVVLRNIFIKLFTSNTEYDVTCKRLLVFRLC